MNRIGVGVLGMGIGGLAVATLLARRGHDVTVYDGMKHPGPVGSGFVLQPTGLEVMDRMGLLSDVMRRGARIDRMLGIVQPSGRTVLDVGYAGATHGVAIQRRALFEILHGAALAAGVSFELGRRVIGIDEGRRPRPMLDTMRPTPQYDLVVDAMGCRSPNHEGSNEIGYGALWATVPWDATAGFHHATLEQRYRKASRMAGVLPVGTARDGDAAMATVFWSVKSGTGVDAWKDDAAALWPEMAPLLRDASPVHATYRHHTRRAIMSKGVIRIGDAWHATSPQLGQGANMALLDALSLDAAVGRGTDVDQALRRHVAQRWKHVHLYQAMSRILTPFYQSDGSLLPLMRDHVVAPLLHRRGMVHAAVSKIVSGGALGPLERIGRDVPACRTPGDGAIPRMGPRSAA